jgi:hypothetical protein
MARKTAATLGYRLDLHMIPPDSAEAEAEAEAVTSLHIGLTLRLGTGLRDSLSGHVAVSSWTFVTVKCFFPWGASTLIHV